MKADLELYEETSWEVYDPQDAKIVAIFHDREAAHSYVEQRNQIRNTLQSVSLSDPIVALRTFRNKVRRCWRVFKENQYLAALTPECGPARWVVWSPTDEEKVFDTHREALTYVITKIGGQ